MAFIEKQKRKHGDRRDGIWVRDVPGLNTIMAALYPNRADCEVCMREELDITDLLKYIEKKNKENPEIQTKLFHCIVAMMVRILNERRYLNRFVRTTRIYERDEISISFVAKRAFSDKAEEALVTYKAKAQHNIDDVSKFILGQVDIERNHHEGKKDISSTINKVAKMPRFLLRMVASFISWLDKYGKVPKSLTNGDPAYSSVLLSNLGSIKCPAVYHHLNNYGTNSIMMTIGTMRKKNVVDENGNHIQKDVLDIAVTADERIADGFYFAKSIKMLDFLCAHPEILDKPFEEDVALEAK